MTHRHRALAPDELAAPTGARLPARDPSTPPFVGEVLRMQRAVGNAAVSAMLAPGRGAAPGPVVQREDPPAAGTAPAQPAGSRDAAEVQASGSTTVTLHQGDLAAAASSPNQVGQAAQAQAGSSGGSAGGQAGATPTGAGGAAPTTAPAPTGVAPNAATPAAPAAGTAAAPSSNLFSRVPVGWDLTIGGGANLFAVDSYSAGGGTGPYGVRGGLTPGAGDLTASVGGALVLRGRYAYQSGSWQFLYEPTFGGSVSLTGMTTDDGRVRPADALAISASADLIHWGSGSIDLHMLNTSLGLGWNLTTGDVTPSAAISPFGFEWHMLPNVSAQIALPFTIARDPSTGNADVTFGPSITFTGNVLGGGPPSH